MKTNNGEKRISGLHSLSLISLLIAMIVVLRFVTRVVNAYGLSGDGSAVRATVVIIGKGFLPKFGSCTAINFLAGVLITLIMPSKEGLFTFMKYLTSGVVFDLLYFVLHDYPRKPILAGVAGIIGNLTQLITKVILGHLVLGFSWNVLFAGMTVMAVTNVFFGFVFGFAASQIFLKVEARFQYLNWHKSSLQR